jgi:hypothetical protein
MAVPTPTPIAIAMPILLFIESPIHPILDVMHGICQLFYSVISDQGANTRNS